MKLKDTFNLIDEAYGDGQIEGLKADTINDDVFTMRDDGYHGDTLAEYVYREMLCFTEPKGSEPRGSDETDIPDLRVALRVAIADLQRVVAALDEVDEGNDEGGDDNA